MTPQRIQLRRAKGWRMPPNTVSVARPTQWGNPWRVGRDGDAAYCVEQYRRCLTGKPVEAWPDSETDTVAAINMISGDIVPIFLANRNLGCWCKPGEPCHADVLLELANAAYASTVVSMTESAR